MSSYETLRAAGTTVVCLSPVSVWISDYMFARFTCEIAMRTVPVLIIIRLFRYCFPSRPLSTHPHHLICTGILNTFSFSGVTLLRYSCHAYDSGILLCMW